MIDRSARGVVKGMASAILATGLFTVGMIFCASSRALAQATPDIKDATAVQSDPGNEQPCGPTPVETCGAIALLDYASLYNVVFPQKRLDEIATAQQGRPMSLLQLRDELTAEGLWVQGYRADNLADIAALDRPVIALVTLNGEGHFVVIERVTEQWVRMLDSGEIVIANREDIADVFSGYVLVPEGVDESQATVIRNSRLTQQLVLVGVICLGMAISRACATLTTLSEKEMAQLTGGEVLSNYRCMLAVGAAACDINCKHIEYSGSGEDIPDGWYYAECLNPASSKGCQSQSGYSCNRCTLRCSEGLKLYQTIGDCNAGLPGTGYTTYQMACTLTNLCQSYYNNSCC